MLRSALPSALLLLLCSSPALAQVYQGQIGPYPIVLQLEKDFTGKYAYLKKGLSIELKGHKQGTLTLMEQVFDLEAGGFKNTGTFKLKPSGKGWAGTWSAPGSQKTLSVQLNPYKATALKLPASDGLKKLQQTDPYTFTLLNHPWETLKNGWVREPYSKVQYPRVKGQFRLNLALQDLQVQEAASALACLSMAGTSEGHWESNPEVTYQSQTLYSLKVDTGYYCGGAHPDSFTSGHVLDVKTGKQLALKDFWSKLTAQKQRDLYLQTYLKKADADCKDVLQQDPSDSFEWHLTRKGLALWPNFLPHVAAACAEEVVLPYSSLQTYGTPGSAHLKNLQ
ncbi:hypothetical protein [Deinococcus roseus]|uniref:DUF3298 domain-containing protein n=1 Tax=Deinococcus roseus TaxID=392414 RepID=A0ABQ2D2C9_9DEIO|nr:hypothetical protein [Deinococcus roseus]GGJ32606.1 hypothetical protein GCM10008938_18510 [Deinococcus roseus]